MLLPKISEALNQCIDASECYKNEPPSFEQVAIARRMADVLPKAFILLEVIRDNPHADRDDCKSFAKLAMNIIMDTADPPAPGVKR